MAVFDPEHFFEQAERLSAPDAAGAPRQVDLRRAISAAYYGVFHFILTAAADQFAGAKDRNLPRYELIYRSIDHQSVRSICAETAKPELPAKLARYAPSGFDQPIRSFARIFAELQEKRHAADYDPLIKFSFADASTAIAQARAAVRYFQEGKPDQRKAFLTFLKFKPR